jgi:hypothetical protein
MFHVAAALYMTTRIVFVVYLLSLTGMRRLARRVSVSGVYCRNLHRKVGVAASPRRARLPAKRERPAVNSAPASTPSTTPARNPNAMSVDITNPLMVRVAAQTRLVWDVGGVMGVTKERRAASAPLSLFRDWSALPPRLLVARGGPLAA